jgi:hypothetical protein
MGVVQVFINVSIKFDVSYLLIKECLDQVGDIVMFDIVWTDRISRVVCFGVLKHLLYGYDYDSKLSLVMDTYALLALVLLMFQA